MNLYYEIFPEERGEFTTDIETMYFGRNLKERSLYLLKPLISEENYVTEQSLVSLALVSAYCPTYLLRMFP